MNLLNLDVQFKVIIFVEMFRNKKKWTLQSDHALDNGHDLFAIKACRDAEFYPQIVSHIPLGISWSTKYLLNCETTITATLSGTYYQRSLLVQRGLEIPWVVNAKLISTNKNK